MSERLPVLIVDDQAPFRAAMKAVLRRSTEFELVGEAANGNEAVAMAEELNPALVLMDINMPEMNGIEATRTLVSRQPGVVVILCSTYDAGDLPPEVATSGARGLHEQGASRRRDAPAPVGRARRAGIQLGLRLLGQTSGTEPRTTEPLPITDSHRTVPPMAPNRSAMFVKPWPCLARVGDRNRGRRRSR